MASAPRACAPWDKVAALEVLTAGYLLGERSYRVELTDAGSSGIVVTSHFYVHAVGGSGGCSAGGGSPGLLLAARAGWIARRRRASS